MKKSLTCNSRQHLKYIRNVCIIQYFIKSSHNTKRLIKPYHRYYNVDMSVHISWWLCKLSTHHGSKLSSLITPVYSKNLQCSNLTQTSLHLFGHKYYVMGVNLHL